VKDFETLENLSKEQLLFEYKRLWVIFNDLVGTLGTLNSNYGDMVKFFDDRPVGIDPSFGFREEDRQKHWELFGPNARRVDGEN
jgi:hypothetical protein